MKTVVLDPGHGGKDPGAVSDSGTEEAAIVLDVCERIRDILHGRVNVVMTRDDDTFVELRARATISNLSEASAFCSVHCNSAVNRMAQGWELFTSVGETQADRLGACIAEHHHNRFPNQVNRGTKEVNFSVLRRTSAPAVLIELGFLSNRNECGWLEMETTRQGHAEYIAEGILEFLGVDSQPVFTLEQRVARLEEHLNI